MEQRDIPEQVGRFRVDHRARAYSPAYRGWLHFAFTSGVSLAVIGLALSRLHRVTPLEWLTVPLAFLVSNAAEYLGHRGPMHHRKAGLSLLFQRHTLEHHRFFTHEAMAYESPRDFKMVLFPPTMLLFFLGGIATPIGALCFLLLSGNTGWLFVATGMGYYLSYEWLHFCHHLPPGRWVARLPGMAVLRRHHTLHHDPSLMGRWNFNIAFPVCDWLLGTWRR